MTAQLSTPIVRTLSITFNQPIYARQIPQWRGAFIEMAGWKNDLLHNHNNAEGEAPCLTAVGERKGEGENQKAAHPYIHRYPVVQYRIHKGKAGIFALNEGIEAVQQVLFSNRWAIQWEGQQQTLQIEQMQMNEHYLRMTAKPRTYKLFKWLALNEENYGRWHNCANLMERVQLLENILTGHILGFATNMNWQLPERLEVSLQYLQQVEQVTYHGVPLLAFNVSYTANVLLPPSIGLGKAVSHGFGWQQPVKVRQQHHPVPASTAQEQIL